MLGEHNSWLLSHTWDNHWHKIKVLMTSAPGKPLSHLPVTTHKKSAQDHRLVASGRAGRQRMEPEGAQELQTTFSVGFASFLAQAGLQDLCLHALAQSYRH